VEKELQKNVKAHNKVYSAYPQHLLSILMDENGAFTLEQRKYFAKHSFNVSSHYDSAIFNYFDDGSSALKLSVQKGHQLRYGENPHQWCN
jgi:phosphoribosylaminoimidazolecarboxamide formyltransferase/IMP cyclohydrolase